MKNYMKLGSFKIILSLLAISLIFLQTQTQQSPEKLTINYDRNSFSAFKTGVINNIQENSENRFSTQFLELNLMNFTVFGKKANITEEIKEYNYQASNNTWMLSKTDSNIIMKSGSLTVELDLKPLTRFLRINFKNSLEVNKTIYNYNDFEYRYEFNYNSFLPYTYSSYESGTNSAFSSGADFLQVTQENLTLKQNSFVINKKEFTITHYIPDMITFIPGENLNKTKISNPTSELEIAAKGGETKVTINRPLNSPKFANFRVLSCYNLNQLNKFQVENAYFNDFSNERSKINPSSSAEEYTTFDLTNPTGNFTQKISVSKMDRTVIEFTNQERLENKTAFYNLGQGENVINQGDIEFRLDFTNYTLFETIKSDINYGVSKFFETTINVNFKNENAATAIKRLVYTYASLHTDKKDDGVKILSVKINNRENGQFMTDEENYITIRTTAFSGNASIRFLFKFFDSNLRPAVLDESIPNDEKLVFRNLGGQFSFVNRTWNVNDKAGFEQARFADIRFDSIFESAKGLPFRSFSTKTSFFNIFTENGKHRASSLKINEESNVDITVQYARLNNTIVVHEYPEKLNQTNIIKENFILNQGEVYVNFAVNQYNPCINNAEGKLPFGCNEVSDTVSLKLYLDEFVPGYDDVKPPVNTTKLMRLLQSPLSNNTNPNENLIIQVTPLLGNYERFSNFSINNLNDFSENFLKFDYNSNSNSKKLQGAFRIKYITSSAVTPTPPKGNTLLYIILAIIALAILVAIMFFFLRRGKLRKASEDARRLNDNN